MALDVPAGTPNRGPDLVATATALMVISIVSTLLRIVSMLVVKRKWWWDDFFAIYSLVRTIHPSIMNSWKPSTDTPGMHSLTRSPSSQS